LDYSQCLPFINYTRKIRMPKSMINLNSSKKNTTKKYSLSEEQYRLKVFQENMNIIEEHNNSKK